LSRPDYPLKIDRRVFVPMSDGVRIALTVYLPDAPNDGPFPAVVESLPYRKDDDCTARDYSTYAYLAGKGIAGIRIDIRGTGASTGVIDDEYTAREQQDTLEVMEWAAAQDWCTGRLGMWGISWGGFSTLQTAMLRPPQLQAIAPMHATHDRFACDVHYTGGSLHGGEQVDWPASMIATNALPPDPDIFGEGWREEWLARLESTPQWPFEWLRHQSRDDYWRNGSAAADYAAIQCPTLLIGGWLDGYIDGMLALAENLTCPTRTVIGPWGHYRPATGYPGPTLDHHDLLARWFGHHLRDDDNGVMDMPALTAFIRTEPPFDGDQVTGYWRAEQAYPPSDMETTAIALAACEHRPTTWRGPQWVGSHAPTWDRAGFASTDSSADDAASVTFTTPAFDSEVEILGTPEVELVVTTSASVGMVAARLLLVSPEGHSTLICRGSRNLVFPDDLSRPVAPAAGEPIRVRFPLMAASAIVPAGWRLRLALSGADFPVVWPPPEEFTLDVDPEQSRLILPLVPARDPATRLAVPPAGPEIEAPVVFEREDRSWSVERSDGRTEFTRQVGTTEYQPDRTDLTYIYDQKWIVSIADHDPATMRAEAEVAIGLRRPGWDVATLGKMVMTGGDPIDLLIAVSASEDGEEIWRREWTEAIPREWA
jgi:putative CocE/NonD family hydrolase